MSDQTIPKTGITRRGFLKATGAAAGAAALVGGGTLTALAEGEAAQGAGGEKIYKCCCHPNCQNICPVNVYVRDGRVVKTRMAEFPDQPEYNRICLRGLSHVQRIYDAQRVKYPMRRVEGTERGAGQWERISWEEALSEIASKFKACQEQYGPQSIARWAVSGGSGFFATGNPFWMRFANATNMSSITASVDMGSAVGTNRVVGWEAIWSSNECPDLVNAKNLFIWANNLTEAQIHEWHFVADAIEAGVNVVVIDPVYTIIASKAHQWVPVRPASDAALVLGMMNVVVSEGLTNVPFLKQHTCAPFLVKEDDGLFLRESDLSAGAGGDIQATGEGVIIDIRGNVAEQMASAQSDDQPVVWDMAVNAFVPASEASDPAIEGSFEVAGHKVTTAYDLLIAEIEQWPVSRASEVSDVPEETIVQLARMAADGPVTHRVGWGNQSYSNGGHPSHALITLAALTGQIGFPGASCGTLDCNGFNDWDGSFKTELGVSSSPTIPVLVFPEVMTTGKFGDKDCVIKMAIVHNGNPLSTVVDFNKLKRDVVDNLEFLVTVDSVMTDTACYSDMVLPCAQWFEIQDYGQGGNHNYVIFNEKAIDPLYESKSDNEIVRLLARELGMGDQFTASDEDVLRLAASSEKCKELGISYDALQEKHMIRWYPDKVKIAYKNQKFYTTSKRMEFYVERPAAFNNYGQEIDLERERLPRFFPPSEAWPENPLFEKYPLTLMTSRTKYLVHGQWFTVPMLRELEPGPTFRINPIDAEARGLEDGAYAEVFNDRGSCVAKTVFSEAVRPGSISYMKCYQRSQHKKGSWSELTSFDFDPVLVNQNFMDALVDVRPWTEED